MAELGRKGPTRVWASGWFGILAAPARHMCGVCAPCLGRRRPRVMGGRASMTRLAARRMSARHPCVEGVVSGARVARLVERVCAHGCADPGSCTAGPCALQTVRCGHMRRHRGSHCRRHHNHGAAGNTGTTIIGGTPTRVAAAIDVGVAHASLTRRMRRLRGASADA